MSQAVGVRGRLPGADRSLSRPLLHRGTAAGDHHPQGRRPEGCLPVGTPVGGRDPYGHLLRRWTAGAIMRVNTVYETPFWRADGLNGETERYGAKAGSPIAYLETDWSSERWSLGGMMGDFAPGILTTYSTALREPVGRIHWASSERATLMHGLMEAAVRSGERTPAEILARE